MTLDSSFAIQMRQIVKEIIQSPELHAKWLNTLSFLENCGARKIAACQHPTLVKEEMLKHAAEEFRHSHYLKRQIERVSSETIVDYSLPYLLGGFSTLNYLNFLDIQASRYLKEVGYSNASIKEIAYLLVTYAIELRAGELYPIYDEILRKNGSKVTVKSILLEEKEHLAEMKVGIAKLPSGYMHASYVCSIESHLCQNWLEAVAQNIRAIRCAHCS